jgi:hypothetical protein
MIRPPASDQCQVIVIGAGALLPAGLVAVTLYVTDPARSFETVHVAVTTPVHLPPDQT